MCDEIDEQHELLMRAIDESRELDETEQIKIDELYWDMMRDRYNNERPNQ